MLHSSVFPAPGSSHPPVVLVHGFASSAAEDFTAPGWVDALVSSGRTVITVDLPGHGSSPAVSDAAKCTASHVGNAILAAATIHAPSGELDVIGYSLGARIAWELPKLDGRVRRLVLGGLSPSEPFGSIDADELNAALAGEPASDPLTGFMAEMISAPGLDSASLSLVIQGLASAPFSPELGGPETPTLLVAGDADEMTEGIEELLGTLPNARMHRVPGDHRGALDSPEFRSAAIAFLSE